MKLKLKEAKCFDQGHKLVSSRFQTSSIWPHTPCALCSMTQSFYSDKVKEETHPAHWDDHNACVDREGKDQIHYFENKS